MSVPVVETERVPEKEIVVPQLVALDFDRTLGDTAAIMERFYVVAESLGVDLEAIKIAQKEIENDGGSFDPLTFVPEALQEQFKTNFLAIKEPPLLYADASELLEMLQQAPVPYHVITYGTNPKWQELKLLASGYQGSYTVLSHSRKGEEISGWKEASGKFINVIDNIRYIADSVSLIDDKAVSFTALPVGCTGFLLKRGEMRANQQGIIPQGVQLIESLRELSIVQGRLVKKGNKRS